MIDKRGSDWPEGYRVEEYEIELPEGSIFGTLTVPKDPCGVVVFAHGSGSSRHSPRNNQVAREMQQKGLATLLFDLLTLEEEKIDQVTREYRFAIDLLGERCCAAIRRVAEDPQLGDLGVGCYGSSTGAAAALIGAAVCPSSVLAVVSRGGRPDLAAPILADVRAPTLFIVGERDPEVIVLNRQAQAALRCENRLEIIPGATHLFEEKGTLDLVTKVATEWFLNHLQPVGGRR